MLLLSSRIRTTFLAKASGVLRPWFVLISLIRILQNVDSGSAIDIPLHVKVITTNHISSNRRSNKFYCALSKLSRQKNNALILFQDILNCAELFEPRNRYFVVRHFHLVSSHQKSYRCR